MNMVSDKKQISVRSNNKETTEEKFSEIKRALRIIG